MSLLTFIDRFWLVDRSTNPIEALMNIILVQSSSA